MHDHSAHQHMARATAHVSPSLLRASVAQRLVIAALFALILWLAVGWALDLWSAGAGR